MEPSLNLQAVLTILGAAQAILFAGALLGTKRGNIHANRVLSALLLTISVLLTWGILSHTRYMLRVPHLAQLHVPFQFLIGPLVFFYVRALLGNRSGLNRRDLWHFSSALIRLDAVVEGIAKDSGQPDDRKDAQPHARPEQFGRINVRCLRSFLSQAERWKRNDDDDEINQCLCQEQNRPHMPRCRVAAVSREQVVEFIFAALEVEGCQVQQTNQRRAKMPEVPPVQAGAIPEKRPHIEKNKLPDEKLERDMELCQMRHAEQVARMRKNAPRQQDRDG